jgi:putative heme-binding domain-containing protein
MPKYALLLLTALIASPLARAADDAPDDTIGLLVSVLKDTPDPAAQSDMLKGLNAALEGKRNVKMPAGWAELYPKLSASPNEEVRKQAQKLAAVFGDAGTLDAMKKTALDATKPADERAKALASLVQKNDPTLPALLQGLLKDKALAEPALKALAITDDPRTPAAILDAYPTLDLPAKRAAINTLSFRPALAKSLMKAVKENKIPKTDLTAYTVRQLRSLNDKEIDAWTNEVWGVAKSSNEQKLAEIAKFKAMLTADVLKTGDASAGRALFSKTCMQCHTLFGEGGHVGPDLTGSNRADLDYLLVNVIDPSAVIAKDYMVSIIYMTDGDAFSGIITKEDDQSVTVTLESSVQTLDRKEIKEIRRSELSMMPEGLLTPLPKQDVVNLITYLRSPAQVPLPK